MQLKQENEKSQVFIASLIIINYTNKKKTYTKKMHI